MIIKFPDKLTEKISKMKQDGVSSLHVVSDFDRTLTKAFVNGGKIHSCYSKLVDGSYMGEDYALRSEMLVKHYYPLEIDPALDETERIKYMMEWWEKQFSLMVKYGFSLDMVSRVVREFGIDFRQGVLNFFEILDDNDIPVLIFSAGLGDVVTKILNVSDLNKETVHVISNFFEFDEEGVAIDYKKPLIHTFSKNEVVVKDFPYRTQIENRKNVILLGDNIGDLGMSAGIDHNCIIRIGFCNHNDETILNKYVDSFDVVITDDGPMDVVNSILAQILD